MASMDVKESVPGISRVDLDKPIENLRSRGYVGFEESVDPFCGNPPIKLMPDGVIARWIAARLGLDFGFGTGVDLALKCPLVHAAVGLGNVLNVAVYEAIPTYGPITLVVVNPPFGLDKGDWDTPFGLDKGDWDTPADAWGKQQFSTFLACLLGANVSESGFCVAVYTTEDKVPEVETTFQEVGQSKYKGALVYIFVSDRTPALYPGQMGLGGCQFVVVGKFGKAQPKAEKNYMMGKFVYFTTPPRMASKYLRPEIDGVLKSKKNTPLNKMQKGLEEARVPIRTLAPQDGIVLSLCNGTATTQVAAALEGPSSVGIDLDGDQVAASVGRLRIFFEREDLLQMVLRKERDPECKEAKALMQVAEGTAPLRVEEKTFRTLTEELSDRLDKVANLRSLDGKEAWALLVHHYLRCLPDVEFECLDLSDFTKV
ncbi:unnamed protein product, partial [Ostreobium quekettii]